MTTITLPNGISISDPTMEVLERILSGIPSAPSQVCEDTERVSKALSTRAPEQVSGTFTKTATECGHSYSVNSPKGAKAALCPSCRNGKGNSTSAAEQGSEDDDSQQEKPQTKRNNGGRRNFEPTPLEEMPEDKEASDNQLDRIRVQASAKLSKAEAKKMEKRITSAPNPNPHGLNRISVRSAASIYRSLKAMS